LQPIRSIADLPFRPKDPLELLNLHVERATPVLDDIGFGWSRVGELWLDDGAAEPRPLRDALVFALHAAEEPEPLADDVELEFFIEEVAKDYSVTVLLSKFLDVWLPRVTGAGERHIVLAMCNPHRALLPRPPRAGATPVHHALGDVDSWLDVVDGRRHVRLAADTWRIAE
jgi:hypothetical protein